MQTAKDVVQADLNLIANSLGAEFAQMAGRSVLIAGGAGFLGYYLVQGALHWGRLNPGLSPIRITILDNFVRGMPAWLEPLRSDLNLRLEKHDITQSLPPDLGDHQYLIHAASIASPIYYRRCPIETMDANVGGLRHMLDYCQAQTESGKAIEGMLFYSSSEIYGDPTPENIP